MHVSFILFIYSAFTY